MIRFKHKLTLSWINYDNVTTESEELHFFFNIVTHEWCIRCELCPLWWLMCKSINKTYYHASQLFSLHTRKHIIIIQVPTCVTLHIKASLPWGNRWSAFLPTSPLMSFFWLVAQFVRVPSWPYQLLNAIFSDSGQLWISPFAVVHISILLFHCASPGNQRKAIKKGGIWTYIVS